MHRILDHVADCAGESSKVDLDVALVADVFDELDVFARERWRDWRFSSSSSRQIDTVAC